MTPTQNEQLRILAAELLEHLDCTQPNDSKVERAYLARLLDSMADAVAGGDVRMAYTRLDDDEKGTNFIPTLGSEQQMAIINGSGLYQAQGAPAPNQHRTGT